MTMDFLERIEVSQHVSSRMFHTSVISEGRG